MQHIISYKKILSYLCWQIFNLRESLSEVCKDHMKGTCFYYFCFSYKKYLLLYSLLLFAQNYIRDKN